MPPFGDWDNSPTKQWYLDRYSDARWASFVQMAVGKRPAEELYDLRKDPDQTNSVAADPAYAEASKQLATRLLNIMQETNDPRLDDAFDRPPYVEQDTGAAADGGASR